MKKLLPLLVLLPLIVFPLAAFAQAEEADWCYTWDFSASENTWEGAQLNQGGAPNSGVMALYNGAGYWERAHTGGSSMRSEMVVIRKAFTLTGTIIYAEMGINNGFGGVNQGIVWRNTVADVTNAVTQLEEDTSAVGTTLISTDFEGTPITITDGLTIGVWNDVIASVSFTDINTQITSLKLYGTGDEPFPELENECEDPPPPDNFIRPLTEFDEDNALQNDNYALYDSSGVEARALADTAGWQFGIFNGLWIGNQHTVQGWSDMPTAKVHAAADGQIVSVTRLTWEQCGISYFQYDVFEAESFFYQLKTEEPAPCLVGFLDPEDVENTSELEFWDYYYLDTRDMFVVTLRYTSEQRFVYLVKNADMYVVAGDQVSAGCVLGETTAVTSIPIQDDKFLEAVGIITSVTSLVPGSVGLVSAGINTAIGVLEYFFPAQLPNETPRGYMNMSLLGEDDQGITLLESLTEWPTNESPCSETEGYRDCLADNPRMMNDGFSWTPDGNVTWLNPGVVLDPNESVTTTLNLNAAEDYTVTFFGQSSGGTPGQARVYLGNNSETVSVLQEWNSESVEFADIGNPNAGFFYTVGIQNTGDVPFEVNSICVTDGEPNIAPHSCYFNNYSFDVGVSGWTGSEGIELQDGSLLVPDDGTFSQNVSLEPETYILKVKAAYWYTGPLDPNSILAAVSYKWPDTEVGYTDLQPAPIEGYAGVSSVAVWVEGTIVVEEATDSEMEFLISTFSSGDTDVLGLQIQEVCLTPEDGTWPGYEGGVPPPIQATCSYISRPTSGDTAAWLQWHWANLNKFFQCDLMVLLNRMYKVMRDTYTLIGWLGRYSIGYANYASIWSGNNLFPWLNGHFRNMAIGQITTIEQGGQVSVWDVLLALVNNIFGPIVGMMGQIIGLIIGLVTQAANLLFTVLTAIISIVLAILTQLFNLLNLGLQLLGTLITAFNTAAPEPIPGIPACGLNPQDGGICVFVWIVDNTIFSGPGAAIIPLLVAILSIHLILWVVGEFKRAVVSVGSTS